MIGPRTSWLRWLAFVVVVAAGVHVAAVAALPNFLMGRAIAGIAKRYGIDTMGFPPLATETARTIVQPSPDLLYSICAFDLSKSNLQVHADVPTRGYWSLTLYGANTNAFLVLNNKSALGAPPDISNIADILLVGPGAADADAHGVPVIHAPSAKGILLVRRLISSPDQVPAEDATRRTAVCAAMAG